MSTTQWHIQGVGVGLNDFLERVSIYKMVDVVKFINESIAKEIEAYIEECNGLDEAIDMYEVMDIFGSRSDFLEFITENTEHLGYEIGCDCIDDYILFKPQYPWHYTEKEKTFTLDMVHRYIAEYLDLFLETSIKDKIDYVDIICTE